MDFRGAFLWTLVDFTIGLLELERDWLMSCVRLLAKVDVNLDIRCRRGINWGLQGGNRWTYHIAG